MASKPEDLIATEVRARMVKHGNSAATSMDYGFFKRRIKSILNEISDRDKVQSALYVITDRWGENFTPEHLSMWAIDRVIRDSNLPDEAWPYVRWVYELNPGRKQQSAEYWLGVWADTHDREEQNEARAMLSALKTGKRVERIFEI